MRPPLGTFTVVTKHASNGGNPYPKEIREQVEAIYDLGEADGGVGGYNALRAPEFEQLRQQKNFPAMSTCRKYMKRRQTHGHTRPTRATGNKFSTRGVHGQDLVNLTIFRVAKPIAHLDEVIAYLSNRNPHIMPYSQSQVCRAEKRIGLSRKVGSKLATKRHRFNSAREER